MTDGTAGTTTLRSLARVDETGRALLTAAHDLLASEGPTALTVRRIAAAAGVSTMNVYSRFGGKDGVLDELFAEGFRRLGERMEATPSTGDTVADLRTCGAAYRDFAWDNPTYYSLMFDRVVPDYEPSAAAKAVAHATLGHLASRVARAMDRGAIARRDPLQVAMALWACQHGLVSLAARTQDVEQFDWEVVAPLGSAAIVRGFATADD